MTKIDVEFLLPLTSSATSFYDYYFNRSLKSFNVNFVPYFPANGEVFTLTETPISGGSILMLGITFSGYPYYIAVYDTLQLGNPAIDMISPANALSS